MALQHNFISALLTIGGGLMKLHYHKNVEVKNLVAINYKCDHTTFLSQLFSGCPINVCNGPAETGKSTSIKAALW